MASLERELLHSVTKLVVITMLKLALPTIVVPCAKQNVVVGCNMQ
jgi:hypothetical protein